jgi:uncharacterized protein with HEPN domain
MNDRDREYLVHMLRYAETAVRILGSAGAVELGASEEKLLAVSRAVQNVGEAATKLSDSTRNSLAEIPWRKVIAMRHHLVHAYDDIRLDIMVATVHEDMPTLIELLRRALADEGP